MATIKQQRLAEIERHLRDHQTRLNDTTQLKTERHCLWLIARVHELEAGLQSQLTHDGHTFRCFYSVIPGCPPDCAAARAALDGEA